VVEQVKLVNLEVDLLVVLVNIEVTGGLLYLVKFCFDGLHYLWVV
jgi:hypothetical protein